MEVTATSRKTFSAYVSNKCIIGYGLINGIVNAAVFAAMHAAQPDVVFGLPDIAVDLALTGLILGVILFACVVPLTRHDLNAGRFACPEAFPGAVRLLPRSYAGAMLALGLVAAVAAVALGAALALVVSIVLPLPLPFLPMMALKGCVCACIGALSGYLTISYVVRG
ncbi:MAG: hypothetical protein V8R48_01565 [Eggerthella lenta]